VHGTVAVVPEKAAKVEGISRRAAEGRNLPRLANTLRKERPPTRKGGAWRRSALRAMLRNRFCTGRVEYDGALIRARHDAIVLDVPFDACAGTRQAHMLRPETKVPNFCRRR
jgi:hypothetical protein